MLIYQKGEGEPVSYSYGFDSRTYKSLVKNLINAYKTEEPMSSFPSMGWSTRSEYTENNNCLAYELVPHSENCIDDIFDFDDDDEEGDDSVEFSTGVFEYDKISIILSRIEGILISDNMYAILSSEEPIRQWDMILKLGSFRQWNFRKFPKLYH